MSNTVPVKVRIQALDKVSQVLTGIQKKFPEMNKAVSKTNAYFKIFSRSTEGLKKNLDKIGGTIQDIGKSLTVGITLPVIAAAGFSVKAFADYETALVGVGKTTNLQGAELQSLGKDFLEMSKKIPVPVEELLGLGQTAAQLGVRGSADILKFSETMGKLSRASNVAGEEGASELARLISVTGGSVRDVDRFASALVGLGNTSAATEAEILSFSTRLGGSLAVFNVSGIQALGMATAMKSLGIEAEAGSSSIQRSMGAINEVITKGGSKMQMLSKLTGISADQLKDKFKKDAAGTLQAFAAGLGNVEKKGGDLTQALAFFGLTGVRDIQVMGTLAKKSELLGEKISMANKAFTDNVALNQEFEAASKTLASAWQIFTNKAYALAVTLGSKLAPALTVLADVLGWVMDFFDRHETIATWISVFALLAAVIGPILLGLGAFILLIPQIITGMTVLSAVMATFGITSWAALAPILIIIAKFLVMASIIGGLIALIWNFRDAIMGGLLSAFEKLKSFFGLGNKIEGSMDVNHSVGGTALSPQGAPLNGLENQSKANTDFMTQTNNARVDVHVRAPQSTMVSGESQNGILSINRGFAGVFQ